MKTLQRDELEVFQAQVTGEQDGPVRTTLMILNRLGHQGLTTNKKEWKYMDMYDAWQGPFSLKGLYRWKAVALLQDVMIMNETTQMWMSFHHLIKLHELVQSYIAATPEPVPTTVVSPQVPEPTLVADVSTPESNESLSQETTPDEPVQMPVPAPAPQTTQVPIPEGNSTTSPLVPVPLLEVPVPVPGPSPPPQETDQTPVQDTSEAVVEVPVDPTPPPPVPQFVPKDSRTGFTVFENSQHRSPVRNRTRGNYSRPNPRGAGFHGGRPLRPYQPRAPYQRPQRGPGFRGGSRIPVRPFRGRNQGQNSYSRPQTVQPARPVLDLLIKLERYPSTVGDPATWENFYQQISELIQQSLSKMMIYVVQAKYGVLWTDMLALLPPWNCQQILHVLVSHWSAVLLQMFPRTAFNAVQEIKTIDKNIEKDGKTAILCLKLASFVRDLFKLMIMEPVKDSPLSTEFSLKSEDPEYVTFEEASQIMILAQSQSTRILTDCMQAVTLLTGEASRPIRTVAEASPPLQASSSVQTTPPRSSISQIQSPQTIPQAPGRGYSSRPVSSPMIRPPMPSPAPVEEVAVPQPVVAESKLKIDYKWARDVTDDCQADRSTGYHLLKFVKELFERVFSYAQEHIDEIKSEKAKLIAMQSIVEKTQGVLVSLKAAQHVVENKNLTPETSKAILTAMKEFISMVYTEAFKYCRRLQMPDDNFIAEFQDRLIADEGDKLDKIVHFFELNYNRMKNLMN